MTRKTIKDPAALDDRIGHHFTDATLRERALTHSSALAGKSRTGSYQQLEFLGDRVLGLAIADLLLRTYPGASEGELSQRLAALVRAETCAAVARAMAIETMIRLGKTKRKAAKLTQTILSDVCEAIVGAVYLDAGYAVAAGLVERFWQPFMDAPVRPLRDAKTTLQEWAQGRGFPAPAYCEVERSGPQHDPEFRIRVDIPKHAPAEGTGRSKRAAEQAAAAAMLAREGVVASMIGE